MRDRPLGTRRVTPPPSAKMSCPLRCGWSGTSALVPMTSTRTATTGARARCACRSCRSFLWSNGHHWRRRQGAIARQSDRPRRCLCAGGQCVGLVAHHAALSRPFHRGRGWGWFDLRATGPSRRAMPSPPDRHLPAGDQVDRQLAQRPPQMHHRRVRLGRKSVCERLRMDREGGPRIASTARTMFRGWAPGLSRGFFCSTARQQSEEGWRDRSLGSSYR